jgi:hypothetical protein
MESLSEVFVEANVRFGSLERFLSASSFMIDVPVDARNGFENHANGAAHYFKCMKGVDPDLVSRNGALLKTPAFFAWLLPAGKLRGGQGVEPLSAGRLGKLTLYFLGGGIERGPPREQSGHWPGLYKVINLLRIVGVRPVIEPTWLLNKPW